MDPAGPPNGNLEQLFEVYDAIRSEGHLDEGPLDDQPPWQPKEVNLNLSTNETVMPDIITPGPSPSDVSDLQKLGYKEKNWNDVRANKQDHAAELLDERLRASHADKLLHDREAMPSGGVSYAQDQVGLEKAYNNASYPGVYYDQNTHTMYVKGTSNAQDWYDDVTKIPVWGNLQDSVRYKDAERAYQDLLQKGMPVDRVLGHSLGGSVALQQQSDHDIPWSRTFGAPVFDLNPLHRGTVDRVRHPLDPVSIFDRSAKWGPLMAYPHTYTGFESFDQATTTPVSTTPVDHKTLALKARGMYV